MTGTFRTRHNTDSALFRADTSKKITYLKSYKKRRLHADRTSDKICEKRLTGYKKLQGGNIALKNARKAKNTTQNCFQVNLFYVKCKKTKIYSTFKVKFTAKCKKCGFLRIFCN